MSAATSPRLPRHGRPRSSCVLDRRHLICIAMRAARGYHVVLYRSTRLRRREDGRAATSGFDSTRPPGTGLDTERTSAIPRRAGVGDPGRGHPGKPVGAVVAAAKVLRVLHASERPLNASEVARAAGLHRGTAYNILRTLQAEGFVGYDEPTRSYAVSLHILELAYGVLRRSGLMDRV